MSEERTERRPRPRGGRRPRRKVCSFCVDKIEYIDYKDINRLRRYTNERGKILPRRMSGNCAKYLAKGRKVFVSGPLTARTYQANDGSTRVSLEVQADDVEFLSSRADAEGMGGAPYDAPAPASSPMAQNSGFTAVETDELPF